MFGFNFFKKNSIIDILPKIRGKYLTGISLSKHTWFGVGGPAEVMYIPEDTCDLSYFLGHKPKNIPVCLIGGGSNLLIRDGGVPGVVIKLENKNFKKVTIGKNTITCGAGLKNIELKKYLISNKSGGLEFLCSIPGVIGGSVKSNSGCFGKEVKDIMLSAEIMNGEGKIMTISPQELCLSYRRSCFPDDWIILSVTFKTTPDSAENIQKTVEEQKAYRIANQPYNERTAGSTFKNPNGLRAWELIKKSSCADLRVGGAKVSEKHCNFLINTGTATAKDIETLGEMIIRTVKQKTYITLEWEIKRLGIEK
jgi:UDP-N-acetylmuramate dehydrogenase